MVVPSTLRGRRHKPPDAGDHFEHKVWFLGITRILRYHQRRRTTVEIAPRLVISTSPEMPSYELADTKLFTASRAESSPGCLSVPYLQRRQANKRLHEGAGLVRRAHLWRTPVELSAVPLIRQNSFFDSLFPLDLV